MENRVQGFIVETFHTAYGSDFLKVSDLLFSRANRSANGSFDETHVRWTVDRECLADGASDRKTLRHLPDSLFFAESGIALFLRDFGGVPRGQPLYSFSLAAFVPPELRLSVATDRRVLVSDAGVECTRQTAGNKRGFNYARR